MHCEHCGFGNSEDDHRCLRCGRRLGTAVLAPASYAGANALAPRLLPLENTEPLTSAQTAAAQAPLWTPAAQPAPRLTQKVIPFAEIQRQAGIRPTPAVVVETQASKPVPVLRKASRPVAASQEYFDFLPSAAPRTLKDAVEAQVYCDLPVATPTHRFVAGIMDTAMIVMGFGLFIAAANFTGRAMGTEDLFGSGKILLLTLSAAFAMLAVFYGVIWVIARRETAGMKWSDLHLVTFDGFAPDGKHRFARFLTTVLSFCSGGLGLLWALADAESLTWHDQISRTFPTVRSRYASFVKQSRRR